MPEPLVLISEADAILELVFNRPAKLNAINGEMYDALIEQTERFATDASLRVMLIRANGKYFSAGVDLNSELGPDPSITSPIRSAFAASICRLAMTNQRVHCAPTSRVMRLMPPDPGILPKAVSGNPYLALCAASRKSQDRDISSAPPRQAA